MSHGSDATVDMEAHSESILTLTHTHEGANSNGYGGTNRVTTSINIQPMNTTGYTTNTLEGLGSFGQRSCT